MLAMFCCKIPGKRRRVAGFAAALACIVSAACAASSASGVPALEPERLHRPVFAGLAPRGISLVVNDVRDPRPESSSQMLAELTRALGDRFRSAGFAVGREQPNSLVVDVAYKDAPLPGYEREDCIWFSAKLTARDGAFAQAEGGACSSGVISTAWISAAMPRRRSKRVSRACSSNWIVAGPKRNRRRPRKRASDHG
jgi:hypothetical protein